MILRMCCGILVRSSNITMAALGIQIVPIVARTPSAARGHCLAPELDGRWCH